MGATKEQVLSMRLGFASQRALAYGRAHLGKPQRVLNLTEPNRAQNETRGAWAIVCSFFWLPRGRPCFKRAWWTSLGGALGSMRAT